VLPKNVMKLGRTAWTNIWIANERTYLGYLRTSIAVSMMGTIIAQLFRLQHAPQPSKVFGYFILSKPLSAICQCVALGIIVIGTIRFWRQQSAMAIGKVHAAGWEIFVTGMGMLLVGDICHCNVRTW
jgi:uncharacterized membrane protein YidH (DUF202 family)